LQFGPIRLKASGNGTKATDPDNPNIWACFCPKGGSKSFPGISLGYWQPTRVVEVTRTSGCMVNLGFEFGMDDPTSQTAIDSKDAAYNLHYYAHPITGIVNSLVSASCQYAGSVDFLYLSELDPTWDNEIMAAFVFPETLLFKILPPEVVVAMQGACAADCHFSTSGIPSNKFWWCGGCQGSMYPLTGFNSAHTNGVRTSMLLVQRALTKMHRFGFARRTSTSSNSRYGEICASSYLPFLKKSQYKLQMTYPSFFSDDNACMPLGMSEILEGAGKEFPVTGEDFGYILWQKYNCCSF
jgi:conjugal transfer pilus assembly protein TraU